jgi:23S rRNA (guanosine2251-2'-O)-methyltransferase
MKRSRPKSNSKLSQPHKLPHRSNLSQKSNHIHPSRNQNSQRQVVGLHAAREVLKVRPHKVTEIWLKEGADRDHELKYFFDFAKKHNIRCALKPLSVLDRIAPSHQGVYLTVSETPQLDLSDLNLDSREKIIILALDQVTDPHNIGAVIRTAWLMGARAILVPENRAGHLSPSAIKVASGGAEHVPLCIVENLSASLSALKEKGFWIYGLSGEAQSLQWDTSFSERVVLVAGAEDKGLRSTTQNACDELIAIPQTDTQASFNASVAMALALYEVSRQHRKDQKPLEKIK